MIFEKFNIKQSLLLLIFVKTITYFGSSYNVLNFFSIVLYVIFSFKIKNYHYEQDFNK